MTTPIWFLFDLGNTVIKLAYERVLEGICAQANVGRDELIAVLEGPGFYRDLERGTVTFEEFHAGLVERIGYRGDSPRLRSVWSDFFDGPVSGIEEVLDQVRERYRVAFLSNSNEVHAEVIPRDFHFLFRNGDRFIFSHRCGVAKPDPEIFQQAVTLLGTIADQVVFIDDLIENVEAARVFGMRGFHFVSSRQLGRELRREDLL